MDKVVSAGISAGAQTNSAIIGGIAGLIGQGIQKSNVNNTLKNNLQLQEMRGKQSLQQINLQNAGSLTLQGVTNKGLIDVENLRGSTARDVENLRANIAMQDQVNQQVLEVYRGQYALKNQELANKGMTDVASLNTQSQQLIQQRQFEQTNYLRSNLQAQLEAAGLPSYLAFIQPDESMMLTRQVRGLNFAQYYPGQRFRRAIA